MEVGIHVILYISMLTLQTNSAARVKKNTNTLYGFFTPIMITDTNLQQLLQFRRHTAAQVSVEKKCHW